MERDEMIVMVAAILAAGRSLTEERAQQCVREAHLLADAASSVAEERAAEKKVATKKK